MSAAAKFASECLDAHNEKRKKHGVSKLKMNAELCRLAESWAQSLLRAGELRNSKNTYKGEALGENIAGKTSTGAGVIQYGGAEVVDQWYAEHKEYDYKTAGSTGIKTGHFSQIVWKGSEEFGVGMASSNGKCIVVAHYYPAGNVIGRHKENVFPATTTSKLKSLLGGKKKERRDSSSSSSSSSDDEGDSGKKKVVVTSRPTASTTTSKVTITKTIRKPDGTVETITEERTETHNNNNDKDLHKRFHNATSISDSSHKPQAKASSQSMKEFQQDALSAHNKYRSKHKAPALKLDSSLCAVAQKWAEHLSAISSLQHSTNKHKGEPLGENIASKWGSAGADYTGQEVVDQWYSEEPCYDYSGRSNAGKSGHFTQVVWKGSSEFGIGKAKDSKGRVYVVANYFPAGNFIGRFADNVSKVK